MSTVNDYNLIMLQVSFIQNLEHEYEYETFAYPTKWLTLLN